MRFLVFAFFLGLLAVPAAAQSSDSSEREDPSAPIVTPEPSPRPVPLPSGRNAERPEPSGDPAASSTDDSGTPRSQESINGRPVDLYPEAPSVATSPVETGALNNGRQAMRSTMPNTGRPALPKALNTNTVRITNAGPDGDVDYDAFHPSVAYNPTAGEHIVVWAGNDDEASLAPGETEIYGVRVNEETGQPVDAPVRISTMGTDGNPDFAALHPSVVYNPVEDDYLVVWQGSDAAGEFEVFGRRVNASDLSLGTQRRLTSAGTDGDAAVDAQSPSVAADPANGTYFLVWHANPNGDVEVFGRPLTATGDPGGSSVVQVSTAGPDGDPAWRAAHADVAYNPASGGFWVVWSGSDDQAGLVAGEREIFLRRVDATGGLLGTDGQRLSAAGTDGDAAIDAVRPHLLVDATADEAYVTWSSNAVDGRGAFEVYGQRVNLSTSDEQGVDDLRLSTMGTTGSTIYSGFASTAAGVAGREYVVAWRGDDSTDDSFEVYLQRVYADRFAGDEGGDDDAVVSSLSDGSSSYGAVTPAIAAGASDTYLLVWSGDTSGSTLVEGEHEIFGQILTLGTPLPVELSSFMAMASGGNIELTWQTLSETNNDRFEVQRRTDGTGGDAWKTVGTVRGAGTSTEARDYRFLDRDLPYAANDITYRLKQVDTDGTSQLSDEIRVDRSGVTRLELLATFPNPARTETTVQFAVPASVQRSSDVRLRLYDVLGRRVRDVRVGSVRERNEVRLGLHGLASGMYFLRLEAGGQVRTQKLTVVR